MKKSTVKVKLRKTVGASFGAVEQNTKIYECVIEVPEDQIPEGAEITAEEVHDWREK